MALRILSPVINAGIWLIAWTFRADERKSIHARY